MTTRSERPTLVVVVGATGSGKTDLSIRLAEHYSSPIVSTDSRQIYKGMPIGTAQPTAEQLSRVEHHFIAERLYAAVENVERKRSDFISLSDKTACLEYGIYCV